ncbi:MAG TPA: hypothetical protein VFL96_10680, partial [Acidobacteriaceae bacterium]|nr:hypothetical protein [Acidobacteriaceae bacterium]
GGRKRGGGFVGGAGGDSRLRGELLEKFGQQRLEISGGCDAERLLGVGCQGKEGEDGDGKKFKKAAKSSLRG